MIDRADNRERSLPQRHVGNTWSQHDLKWQGEIEQSGSDAWLLEDHLQELDIRLQSLEDLQLSLSGDMYDRAVMTRKSPLPCQPFIKKRSFIHERAEELPLTPSSPRKRGRAVRTSSAPSGPLEKLRKISSVGDREFIADNDMISPIDDSTAMFDAPPASRQRSFAAELKRISKIATVELEVTWSAPDFKTCRQIGGTYSSLKIASGRYETGDPSPPSTMVPDDGDDDYMQDVEISEVDSLSPDEDKMLLTIDPEAWAEEVEFLTRRGL